MLSTNLEFPSPIALVTALTVQPFGTWLDRRSLASIEVCAMTILVFFELVGSGLTAVLEKSVCGLGDLGLVLGVLGVPRGLRQ